MLKLCADGSMNKATSLLNPSGYPMTEDQFVEIDDAVLVAREDLPFLHMRHRHYRSHPNVYENLIKLVTPKNVILRIFRIYFRQRVQVP